MYKRQILSLFSDINKILCSVFAHAIRRWNPSFRCLPGENALFQSTNIGYFFGVRGFCAEIMTGCKFFCRKLWGGNFFYLSESFEPIKLEVYEKVALDVYKRQHPIFYKDSERWATSQT